MDNILVVDDTTVNRKILIEILGNTYKIIEACDGEQALAYVHSHANEVSLILLDIIMPKYSGYEVLQRLKENRITQHIPVILISSLDSVDDESRGLSEGAIDYITKPFSPTVVKCRVRNHIELKRHQDHLQELVDQRAQKVLQMRESVFDAVTSIVEYRSLESGLHVKRIRLYTKALQDYLLAHRMFPDEIDGKAADIIMHASSLHDIGKVSIPDSILMKPGKLTPLEFDIMKSHVLIGCEFIDTLEKNEDDRYEFYARQICRHHHERWDGTGYPDCLSKCEIPLSARVVAIADVYDALVSRRVYKPPVPHNEAVTIISNGRGTQFDPCLVEVFEKIASSFEQIALSNNDES